MARLSGFSHFTLWKALRRAADQGLLIVKPGRRPRFKDAPEKLADPWAGLRKWERLQREIERDLLRGEWDGDSSSLSMKVLGGKYRVSFRTLAKALHALESAGKWPPNTRRKRETQGNGSGRNLVIYLAWGDEKGDQYFENPFDHAYLESLRSGCARLNLEPVLVVYTYQSGKLHLIPTRGREQDFPSLCKRAMGFLLRTACPHDVGRDLIPLLAGYGPPIAVLDELGHSSLTGLEKPHSPIKVFRHTISEVSGELMALHLLAQGHRRVALISPFHGAAWSKNRLSGVARALTRSASDAIAASFTLDLPYHLPHQIGKDNPAAVLRKSLGKIVLPAGLSGALTRFEPELRLAIRRESILEALNPLLKQALQHKELTAWVAVDDDTAMLILDFLRHHHRVVPADVSLVGFDNTGEGARSGLTSYDFDFERFNYYVLRYLLEPERVLKSERQGASPPPGRIVMRGSVRRLDTR